ncbi:MAG: hypothetical protein JNK72_20945 [Myxococcales bacterium]|nr:hypothetical protein [Myxococcales bacterium]
MQHRPQLALTVALVGCLAACAAEPSEPRTDAGADGGGFVVLPDGGAVPQCRGNRDGVIDRGEVTFLPGVEVRYRVNPANSVARLSTRGAMQGGTRVWDFRDPAGELVSLRLERTEGQWFTPRFAGAEYAARLDPRQPLLGVYRATDAAVFLLGAAGPSASSQTIIPYNPPLEVLRFPLRVGLEWTAEATTQDAQVEGTPAASRDTYAIAVDARGTVQTEAITFTDALRVRVELTQRFPAGPGTRRIQYLWLVECYGEVARAVSREGELDPDFTEASEFRRLGL